MPDIDKQKISLSAEEVKPGGESKKPSSDQESEEKKDKKPVQRPTRNIVPIIMSLTLFMVFCLAPLKAQMDIGISLQGTYSDNVFQISEYDFERFSDHHPNLDYVDTTDDLALTARFDLAYPIHYQWWKFTPSVTGRISQNVSNPDKKRQDALLRFRVDRYYWNFTALYGYYPNIYIRSYIDSDGSGELEKYSYEKNLWRGDLNLKPIKGANIRLHGRYEQYFYNQYWTEYDSDAITTGLELRYWFPAFSLSGSYYYRVLDNHNHDAEDASYESNIYGGSIRLKSMPLSEKKPDGVTFYPSFGMTFEERFFQSGDDWYGGRVYDIYGTDAALNFEIDDHWNLKLDYSHTFRNVESPVAAVRRLREYDENRFSATVKYEF